MLLEQSTQEERLQPEHQHGDAAERDTASGCAPAHGGSRDNRRR